MQDAELQFSKGGFLVRVVMDSPPALYSPASLELQSPAGTLRLDTQVVLVTAVGVALAFETCDALNAWTTLASAQPFLGESAIHSVTSTALGTPPPAEEAPQAASIGQERAAMIQKARHGTKDERMRIIRSNDKSLHRFVVQNPGLGLDEVVSIAKSSTVATETLKFVADRREWASRSDVAIALVRNAKCPVPVAIKMLANVSPTDLRQLAKTSSVRMPIAQAARKRLLSR